MPKLFENIPKSVLCVTQRRPLVPGTRSSSHTSFRASGGGRAGLTGVRGQHRFPSPHPRGPCQAEHKDLWDGDVHSLSLSPCTEGLEEASAPSKPSGRSCTFLTACGDTQQRWGGTDGDWAMSGGTQAGPVQRAFFFIHFLEATSEGPSVTTSEGTGGPAGLGVGASPAQLPLAPGNATSGLPTPAKLSPHADEGAALLHFVANLISRNTFHVLQCQ